jgi:non-homologous end joining protein Ku
MSKKIIPSVKAVTVNIKRTICEVHREMYDILCQDEEKNKELINLLEEAFVMGKKLNYKLRQYKDNYDDAWWELTKKKIVLEKLSKRKERGKK